MAFSVKSRPLVRLCGLALGVAIIATAATRFNSGVWAEYQPGSSGTLTDESIKSMLTNMGYEFKEEKVPSGKTETASIFAVKIERDGWPITYSLQLSPNKMYFWISAGCDFLPKDNKDVSAHLKALLAANDTPAGFFGIQQSNGLIVLEKATENHGFTPADFRKLVDNFDGMMRRTAPLWDASKWDSKPATAPSSAEMKESSKSSKDMQPQAHRSAGRR